MHQPSIITRNNSHHLLGTRLVGCWVGQPCSFLSAGSINMAPRTPKGRHSLMYRWGREAQLLRGRGEIATNLSSTHTSSLPLPHRESPMSTPRRAEGGLIRSVPQHPAHEGAQESSAEQTKEPAGQSHSTEARADAFPTLILRPFPWKSKSIPGVRSLSCHFLLRQKKNSGVNGRA